MAAPGSSLALWLIDLLLALVTPSLPQLHDVTIDGRVLAVTAAVSLLSSVAFGLVPALQASRVDLQDVAEGVDALGEPRLAAQLATRCSSPRSRSRWCCSSAPG